MTMTSNQANQTPEDQSLGVPPRTPEAHQRTTLTEIFGEPIHVYARQKAIQDGHLVEVSEMAQEAGFRFPVALTRAAWEDCVAWTDADSKRQIYQDESGRLWDVLWMAAQAAKRRRGECLAFQFYRVPRGGRGIRPRLTALHLIIGPGDHGGPVMTIMTANED